MNITRAPLRITLGGGGTDLASYSDKFGGHLISAAIDQYVYVIRLKSFEPGITIKYRDVERVKSSLDIRHPLIREAFRSYGIMTGENGAVEEGMELVSAADVPGGTGLGSSGAFTVAMVSSLADYVREKTSEANRWLDYQTMTKEMIAETAYGIEHVILKEPVGRQDQYISALGGIQSMTIGTDGKVSTEKVVLGGNMLGQFRLYFTNYERVAGSILQEQDNKSKADDAAMIANLHETKAASYEMLHMLQEGDYEGYGYWMNWQWEQKRKRVVPTLNDARIACVRELGLKAGAVGCKLIGAGGGGFLMFLIRPGTFASLAFEQDMRQIGLRELKFEFTNNGVGSVDL